MQKVPGREAWAFRRPRDHRPDSVLAHEADEESDGEEREKGDDGERGEVLERAERRDGKYHRAHLKKLGLE